MKTWTVLFVTCLFTPIFSVHAFTFRPQWTPQAQFAGFYMAAEKGFYKDAGIDMEIRHGGPGIMAVQEVSEKQTDFAGAHLIPAIRFHVGGMKIVHIAQIFQRPAQMLIARKSSGIDSVTKFSGRTLGVWPGDFQILPKALLRKYRIRKVKIFNQDFTMEPFIKGEIDVASAMRYNEYHQVLETGVRPEDLIEFNYSELGMNLPEDAVFVHRDFWKSSPDICRKFVEATFRGWKYAFGNRDETVRYMTEVANETDFKTTEHKQRVMLDEVKKLIDMDSSRLKKEDFERTIRMLKESRIIKTAPDYDTFTGADMH